MNVSGGDCDVCEVQREREEVMTKDEARDAAWTMMNSGIDGTLDSGHDYFDNGFDAGYDFAKQEDRWIVVRDEGLPKARGWYEVTTSRSDVLHMDFDPGHHPTVLRWRREILAWKDLPEPYKESDMGKGIRVPIPCPDGKEGCAVFHFRYEDDRQT